MFVQSLEFSFDIESPMFTNETRNAYVDLTRETRNELLKESGDNAITYHGILTTKSHVQDWQEYGAINGSTIYSWATWLHNWTV